MLKKKKEEEEKENKKEEIGKQTVILELGLGLVSRMHHLLNQISTFVEIH